MDMGITNHVRAPISKVLDPKAQRDTGLAVSGIVDDLRSVPRLTKDRRLLGVRQEYLVSNLGRTNLVTAGAYFTFRSESGAPESGCLLSWSPGSFVKAAAFVTTLNAGDYVDIYAVVNDDYNITTTAIFREHLFRLGEAVKINSIDFDKLPNRIRPKFKRHQFVSLQAKTPAGWTSTGADIGGNFLVEME